jgi:multidrug resistance protein MdtO
MWQGPETPSHQVPLLPVLEQTMTMLRSIFSDPAQVRSTDHARLALIDKPQKAGLLVGDAFTNRDHLSFALRGCLAASLCYVLYNALDWPGINTAVATCIITALGTIGSSRQKQVLRISGAIVGGFVISLPAQVFLLPLMDSITAFTFYFMAVTAVAAWCATASPRLSYFGLQIALAFYLINLQEFTVQISLAVARDRVVGVLLGLFAMWLLFDQLGAARAGDRMLTLLRANLDSLAAMVRLVAVLDQGDERAQHRTLHTLRALRETINADLSQMNEQADALQFEVGAGRAQKLRARERMQAMQPAMRTIFLLEIALAQYRSTAIAGERAPGIRALSAIVDFQHACEAVLTTVARRSAGAKNSPRERGAPSRLLLAEVHATLKALEAHEPVRSPVVALCREIAKALDSLWQAHTAPTRQAA